MPILIAHLRSCPPISAPHRRGGAYDQERGGPLAQQRHYGRAFRAQHHLRPGPRLVKARCGPWVGLPLDVHLMIGQADPYIPDLAEDGPNRISFHPEAGRTRTAPFQLMLRRKAPGVVLSPGTQVAMVRGAAGRHRPRPLVMTGKTPASVARAYSRPWRTRARLRAIDEKSGATSDGGRWGGGGEVTPETAPWWSPRSQTRWSPGHRGVFRGGPAPMAAKHRRHPRQKLSHAGHASLGPQRSTTS